MLYRANRLHKHVINEGAREEKNKQHNKIYAASLRP